MTVSHRLQHSFCSRADYNEIPLEGHERVILTTRAHPVTNLPWAAGAVLMLLLPILFGGWVGLLPLNSTQRLFLLLAWYSLVFAYAIGKFFFWFFNIGVLTTKRIIDIDAVNLMNSHTTITTLDKVEEVDKHSLGIWGALFDYADIHIETAGNMPNIEFLKTPQPNEMVNIINTLVKRSNGRKHH